MILIWTWNDMILLICIHPPCMGEGPWSMKIRNVFGDKFGQDRVDLIHYLQRAGHESWDGKDPSAPRHADVADGCSWLFHVVSCCFMLFRESCGFRVSPFLTMFVALERCRMVLLTPRSNGGLGAMSKDPVVSPCFTNCPLFALLYLSITFLRQKGPVNLWLEKRSSDFVRSPCI